MSVVAVADTQCCALTPACVDAVVCVPVCARVAVCVCVCVQTTHLLEFLQVGEGSEASPPRKATRQSGRVREGAGRDKGKTLKYEDVVGRLAPKDSHPLPLMHYKQYRSIQVRAHTCTHTTVRVCVCICVCVYLACVCV